MARRIVQAGSVFQKARNKSDRWDAAAPCYGRYWKDVPGAPRRREIIPLGICRTRSMAERKCAEYIEKLGINSTRTFVESTTTTTFKQQAELWLKTLASRRRDPLEQTTIDNRRYALDKWILPHLGQAYLAEVNNLGVKTLVDTMAAKLSPASIRHYTNIVKAVVASALDENGEEKFPRKWNDEFIDAPLVRNQRQPTTDADGVTAILQAAAGQYRVLYALLAGCGPMRVGEALALEIDKHISPDFRTLHIRQKAKRGVIQPYLKTQNGERDIDLCTSLAKALREFISERKSGLVFQTSTGSQLLQANTLQDSLHPILKGLDHIKGGFNIFRRFRITLLGKSDCPDALKHFWSGHAHRHVSERYTRLFREHEFRLNWAEKIGLGFELPRVKVGQLGQLIELRKAV